MSIPAVITTGGEGMRMRQTLGKPLTKSMVPVRNRPIIEHQILQLKKAGITTIHILESYGARRIQRHFNRSWQERHEVTIHHHYVKERIGSAGHLRKILEEGLIPEETILLWYGDILSKENIEAHINAHLAHRDEGGLITILGVRGQYDKGVISIKSKKHAQNFIISEFDEKPNYLINSGKQVVETSVVAHIPEVRRGESVDFARDVLIPLTRQEGNPVRFFPYNGPYFGIDDWRTLKEAEKHLLDNPPAYLETRRTSSRGKERR